MEFGSNEKTRAISGLTESLFLNVLRDEDPIFIGDEATILDVSMAQPAELVRRCSEYCKTAVLLEDLRRPLWQLLPELEAKRVASEGIVE